MNDVRRMVLIALLSGIAVVVYAVESFIPTPSPWLRFGFSHIITLFSLIFFGTGAAFLIFLLRTFIGSLLIGKLFSPTFILGLGGGALAVTCMAVMLETFKGRVFSIVGISVVGAWVNNFAQVILAYLLFVGHQEILLILPVFLLFAVATGIVNGIAVYFLDRYGRNVLRLPARFSFKNSGET